jgi:hypothetical protein
VLGSNALLCCERFGWSLEQFVSNSFNLSDSVFKNYACALVSDEELLSALFSFELICLREGYFGLSTDLGLSSSDIGDLVNNICCL